MTPKRKENIRQAAARIDLWLHRARPGDKMVYHQGLLTEDRYETIYSNTTSNPDGSFSFTRVVQPHEPVHSIALAMALAEEDGLVLLTQRRLGPCEYEYIATRTQKGLK